MYAAHADLSVIREIVDATELVTQAKGQVYTPTPPAHTTPSTHTALHVPTASIRIRALADSTAGQAHASTAPRLRSAPRGAASIHSLWHGTLSYSLLSSQPRFSAHGVPLLDTQTTSASSEAAFSPRSPIV